MEEFDPAALVDSGFGLLSRFFGPDKGWTAKLSADDLDVSSMTGCPLAQIFGDYCMGRDLLAEFTGEGYRGFSARHGFDAPDDGDEEGYFVRCEALTEEWKRRIISL